MPNLYNILKAGYGKKDSQSKLEQRGFRIDPTLSNHNEQTYYNPTNHKLLYNVNGTHNLADVYTDVQLALGNIKGTARYKEARNTLDKAREKYHPKDVSLTGHSLGGTIASYIAKPNEKATTYNKGITIGQKTRSNETAYRSHGDLVSLFGANATRMKTIGNPNFFLKAHSTSNLRDKNVRI